MFEDELKKYEVLNELSEPGGIVVFGGTEDAKIPLGELQQAFSIDEKIYNRSVSGLSICDAQKVYDACIMPLAPETVFLHIGDADISLFAENSAEFIGKYAELIAHIKSQNKKCRVAIVSLRNYENKKDIAELNQHLKYIAESNDCEYIDIANPRVWNPRSTKETVSFLYSLGFVRPLKCKRPLYDLGRIFFMTVN